MMILAVEGEERKYCRASIFKRIYFYHLLIVQLANVFDFFHLLFWVRALLPSADSASGISASFLPAEKP